MPTQEMTIITPDWLIVIIFFLGIIIGWIARIRYEKEARKDEELINKTLNLAWLAGRRNIKLDKRVE